MSITMTLVKYSCLRLAVLFVSGIWGVVPATTADQSVEIITFGRNDSAWNEVLGVSALRLGCSGEPAECAARAEQAAQDQEVDRIYLATRLSETSPLQFAEYARLSGAHEILFEVGFDDFVGQYARLGRNARSRADILDATITALKSGNADLKFGITLYENELSRNILEDKELPARIRDKVDNVHLYLHYRSAGPNYRRYLQEAETLFPKARIIAGAYAYDRIDYLPCNIDGSRACTIAEEIELFRAALDEQLALLTQGKVAGIEFYPAQFGREESWRGWNKARICKQEHRERCIETTLMMRQIVRERLADFAVSEHR